MDAAPGDIEVTDGRLQIETVGIAYRRLSPREAEPDGEAVARAAGEPGSGRIREQERETTGDTGNPAIVMLHEGLGSITQWRELPEVLARRCQIDVIAYDRSGYGRSDPVPETYTDGFMEREATDVLPAVLGELGVQTPVLVGHSDGASISLIAAGSGSAMPLGVAVIAPHSFIEDICIDGIRTIDGQREQVISALARHHDHPRLAFERWRNAWLTPRFRHWDIRPLLERIDCPVLVLQGEGDQYGTEAQVTTIVQSAPNATGHLLADCGHIAHRDQPERIADYLTDFVSDCRSSNG